MDKSEKNSSVSAKNHGLNCEVNEAPLLKPKRRNKELEK